MSNIGVVLCSWTTYFLSGMKMQRISLGWFCELGAAVRPLISTQGWEDSNDALPNLFRLKQMLEVLTHPENPIQIALRATRPIIWALISELNEVFSANESAEKEYETRRSVIYGYIAKLDIVLTSELAVQPTYHVAPKRAYDVDVLVENASAIFATNVRQDLSAAERYDIDQAGRCLAFEIPTAAAFHIFRAMEHSIRAYYRLLVGTTPNLKMRSWGAYIANIKKCSGNPIIIAMLEQIKDQYRNPIIHPEHQITSEEAMSLIGMAESTIAAMKREINQLSYSREASRTS